MRKSFGAGDLGEANRFTIYQLQLQLENPFFLDAGTGTSLTIKDLA